MQAAVEDTVQQLLAKFPMPRHFDEAQGRAEHLRALAVLNFVLEHFVGSLEHEDLYRSQQHRIQLSAASSGWQFSKAELSALQLEVKEHFERLSGDGSLEPEEGELVGVGGGSSDDFDDSDWEGSSSLRHGHDEARMDDFQKIEAGERRDDLGRRPNG